MGPKREPQCIRGSVDKKDSDLALADRRCAHEKIFIRWSAGDPMIPVANVPEAGLEYIRALREVKYHDSLFEVLAKQYEAARIDEAKEAPVIQVVDPAVPPERKSGPHRAILSVLGAMMSAFSGAIFVFFTQSNARKTRLPG